jgi:hypothetical protein
MRINNILFLHSPRTGGTNFEKILGFNGHYEIPRCGTSGYGQNLKNLMGGPLTHSSYNELIKKKLIHEGNKLIKVSILRNPYFRVISLYKYFGGERKWGSFESFLLELKGGLINNYFYRPQFQNIERGGSIVLDDCIRFSRYSQDMEAFSNKYNLNLKVDFDKKKQHEKSIKSYLEFYKGQRENSKAVEELYREDFENLNY